MIVKPYQIPSMIKQIQTDFSGGLVYGMDLGVIQDISEKIATMIVENLKDDFRVIKVTSQQLKENKSFLVDEGNSQSFMGGRKILWIKEPDSSCLEAVELFFNGIKTDSFLLVGGFGLNKTNPLVHFFSNEKKALIVPCYQEEQREIQQFILSFLTQDGFKLEPGVINLLLQKLGAGRINLKAELEKLIIYMGEKKNISTKDVEEVITDSSDSSYDELCIAIAIGNQINVDKQIQTLLLIGESPVTITRIISNYFLKLLEGVVLYEQHMEMENILKKILKPAQFKLKSTLSEQIRTWGKTNLVKALSLLLQTEIQLKSATISQDLILSRGLFHLTSAAKKQRNF